jgi:hypothetical protein
MDHKIPEIEARDILLSYEGYNNQLLEWKRKFLETKNFKLTRPQSDYVLKYNNVTPKVAKKYLNIVLSFGEKLMEDKLLPKPPEKIWCEKLLCETDKAYHLWGKILDSENNYAFWIPKAAILQEEKKLNRVIDYSPYNSRPPLEHQKIAIEKLLANDKFILADDMGLGKAIQPQEPVLTPKGWKPIGELELGEEICDINGKTQYVIGKYEHKNKKFYKVTFTDGEHILCCDEHLWAVNTPVRKKRGNEWITKTTQQLIDEGLTQSKSKNTKWFIPVLNSVYFEKRDVTIDPYIMGLLLGDGCFSKNNVSLSTDDYEILSEMSGNLTLSGYTINRRGYGYDYRIAKNVAISTMSDLLSEYGLWDKKSKTKFIPNEYLYNSEYVRMSILQGLMDTDGYVSKEGTLQFYSISKELCEGVKHLVWSLGGIAKETIKKSPKHTHNGEVRFGQDCYVLTLNLPIHIIPFRLTRKIERLSKYKKYNPYRGIKSIEFHGYEDGVCISVSSPERLYITKSFIVTHNTTSAVIASLESGAKKVLIVCPASLKINWDREIKNYTNKKVLIVEGRKWGSTFDYYIINYDIIKNYHTTDNSEDSDDYKLLVNANFDLAIIDEAHYVSNNTAQRTRLLNDVLDKIPKVWLLTGTPMTSRPINYFNLLKIVNSPLTLNWQSYVRRYCAGYQFRVNGRKIWNTSGASNLDELRERTKSLVLRRLKTDVLDLPEKLITPVFLELKSTFYDEELEEFMRITKENKEKESISVTINRLMKIRQLIAIEKVPYTCEIIDKFVEQGKKVIVFTNFTSTLDAIQEKYKKKCVTLDGRMSKDRRQESVDRFQNEDKVKIFISNIVAGGVGITLTAAETVIMNDLSFVPAHHSQAEDRAYRYGQKNNVLVYYPIFENTIEKIIYNILQKKKNVIDQVMGDGEFSESFSKDLLKSLI